MEATKPPSSRGTSAEIFVVGLKYKAPAKIDPRLLDHKTLFEEVEEAPRSMGPDALLKMKAKQRRFREGYEDGISSTHKSVSAVAFILSDHPVELLGRYTMIDFHAEDDNNLLTTTTSSTPSSSSAAAAASLDNNNRHGSGLGILPDGARDAAEVRWVSELVRQPSQTDEEVRTLCQDLQVLGRSELKHVLKWRLGVRRRLDQKRKAEDDNEDEDEDEEKKKEQKKVEPKSSPEAAAEREEEILLLKEMSEIRDRMEARTKRDKRRQREDKKKAKIRAAQSKQNAGEERDQELFDLHRIKTRDDIDAVAETHDLSNTKETNGWSSGEEEEREVTMIMEINKLIN